MWDKVTDIRGVATWIWALGLAAATLLNAPGARAAATPGLIAQSQTVSRNRASDLVWGRNIKGPYTLSRRLLVPGSETVYLNGARAFRPVDYQIDYNAGTITFAYPLPTGQAARVDFSFDPKNSALNTTALKAPLSLDLAQLQLGSMVRGTLQFNGIWKMPEQQGQEAVLQAIGMGMDTQLGGSTRVNSLFAFTPVSARAGRSQNDLDASSMKVSAETKLSGLQAKANFMRTGRAFAAAKEYNLKQGAQAFDLSTAYQFNKYLAAKSSMQRSEVLAEGGGTTAATTTVAHEVTANVTPSSRLTVGHNARQTETANQPDKNTITDRIQLDQRLGNTASAQLRHEVVTNESDGVAQSQETTGVKLDARITGGTRVTAERVEARTENQDPAISTQVGLSAGGPAGLRLEGQYAQHERPGAAPEETRIARVEAAPLAGVKIGGGVTQLQVGANEQIQKHALLELKPLSGLHLIGRLNTQEDGSGREFGIVRSVDARLKPLNALEISGNYKEREQNHQDGPQTYGVNVVLAPAQFLQLKGSLVRNPEEGGAVRAEERRSLGLRSDLGALSLTGGYSQRLSVSTAEALAQELEVGLSIQVSKYDRLFSSFRLAEQAQSTGLQSEQYRFGYTRWMGNTFGLSLEGEYLRFLEHDQVLTGRNEARATAGLNARF